MKVLIADKTADECLRKFGEFPEIKAEVKTGLAPEELIREIRGYQGLVVRSETLVTREVIETGVELRVIGRAGTGVDNIDLAAAAGKGIVVMNTPGGNAGAVAELVIGLMFALSRHITRADASMKAGKWDKKSFLGTELAGRTLGIIGIGSIGARVGRKALALDMEVIAHDPYVAAQAAPKMGVRMVEIDELLRVSDYISLHVPGSKDTEGFIDRNAFAKMKDGVYFINCSRGGIVVDADLLQALEEGKVAGAALDVYEKEPPEDSALVNHPLLIATPHIGASSKDAQIIVAEMIAEQVGKYLTSGEIINPVYPHGQQAMAGD